MEALQAWATVAYAAITGVGLAGVIAAAIFAGLQVKAAREAVLAAERASRFSAVQDLVWRFNSPTMRQARRLVNRNRANLTKLLKKWDKEDAEEYYIVTMLANYFEDLGLLEHERHLELSQIKERFRSPLITYYRAFAGYICQEQAHDPETYKWFKTLFEKMGSDN